MALLSTTKASLVDLTSLTRIKFAEAQAGFVLSEPKQLFIEIPYDGGISQQLEEFDTETFAEDKPEGTDAVQANFATGYNVTLTYNRVAIEVQITEEMRRRNRYREIAARMGSLTHFIPNRMEIDLTHIFTFASSTTYTNRSGYSKTISVGDGLALASTVHTLNQVSTTYSNRISGDPAFSKGAIEAAMKLANTNVLNNFGEKRTLDFNTIITGDDPNTVHTVREYLESQGAPDAAHSGIVNVLKSKYRHIILKNLATAAAGTVDTTKPRWWFLAAIGHGDGKSWPAYFCMEEAPNMNEPFQDPHNDNWTFGARASYAIRVVSGRGIICSLPTS